MLVLIQKKKQKKQAWIHIFYARVKAAFRLIYILIVYILLVNKLMYKCPNVYIKT